MMRFRPGRLAMMLAPVVLLGGCASFAFGPGSTAGDLADRLRAQLKADIAAGRVIVDRLPDGARVTFVESKVYAGSDAALDTGGYDALTNMIQALVDPSLIHIEIAGASAAPVETARVQALTQDLQEAGLGPTLRPAAMPPTVGTGSMAPQGVTVTVTVNPG